MKTLNLTVLGIDINPNPGMDTDVIIRYLNDIGVYAGWEE